MAAERAAGRGFLPTPRQTEKQFQASVVRYAELMGWRTWSDRATNRRRRCPGCGAWTAGARNAAGLPDLILVRRPRLVWVELKSDRGTLRPEQTVWLEELRASGQEVYLWRPSDWETIERVLR